jgi:lysophospholipase L1-like esterase
VVVHNGGALGCTLLHDARVRGYWGEAQRPFDPCATRGSWPAILERFAPDVVVALFGAWDVYDASWDGGDTWHAPGDPEWTARYEAEVADAAARLTARGARVLWLAPPCFAASAGEPDAGREWYDPERVETIAEVMARVAARTPGTTLSRVLAETGCPVDLDRRPDGVHYSDPGADAAAAALEADLRRALVRPGR